MEETNKKQLVEKRVRPTVIRRRKKELPQEERKRAEASAVAGPAKAGEVTVIQKISADEEKPKYKAAPETPVIQRIAKPQPSEKGEGGGLLPVVTGKETEEKEKAKKGRKKKTKAELELEDIRRAGGLKKFAQMETAGPEWEPSVERVFEPTLSRGRRKRVLRRDFRKTQITETKASKKVIKIEKNIAVADLSQHMGVKTNELIQKLMSLDVMVTANQSIDVDTAALIANEYGFEVEHTAFREEEVFKEHKVEVQEGDLKPRAPVVTVMGHVDHGKTSVLDTIRKTKVTEQEAGGITQHIGAYEVFLEKGSITFIDTPGHAAFTQMRARGAQVTDIVVLVVAADDGIMPQTIEAINHAKAAGVPIIVAINKIDKPQADAEKVKRGLSEQGLSPEDWGGDVVCVPTSAKTGEGIEHLLEMILLTAEMKEFKGKFEGPGQGVVIESRLDKGRGAVATVLVQRGLLNAGDYVVSGLCYGRIRAMIAADGKPVEEAGPSKPVELLGLNVAPEAGDELFVVQNERDAKRVVQTRQQKERSEKLAGSSKLSLEALQEKLMRGESHELPLVIKADVGGSVEALTDALEKLGNEKVKVNILHRAAGGITESDVVLAQASGAVIIGFNVSAEGKARKLAEKEGLEIRIHTVIYEVLDDVKKAMEGLLRPTLSEKYLGRAKVKQVFKISKVGNIAGCGVTDGLIRRSARIRLTRDGTIVFEGKIDSLKHMKEDAREIQSGKECGIGIENFNDIKEGDEIEAYQIEETKQTLD